MSLEDYWTVHEPEPTKEFVSKVEELKPAKELDFEPTPGFGEYKIFFPKDAVAHPAKMNARLLEYLITRYTEPGHRVLDPMGGTGSTGVMAALHGRDAVVVELEEKFVKWAEKAKARVDGAPTINAKGRLEIIRGDARDLSGLLAGAEAYGKANLPQAEFERFSQDAVQKIVKEGGLDAVVSSPPYHTRTDGEGLNRTGIPNARGVFKRRSEPEKYSDDKVNNIGQITAHGQVDAVIGSPPYANSANSHDRGQVYDRMATDPASNRFGRKSHPHTAEAYSGDPSNIGNLSPGSVDEVITSPAYSNSNVHDYGTTNKALLAWEARTREELARTGFIEYNGKRYTEEEWRALNHGELKPRGNPALWAKIIQNKAQVRYNDTNPANIANLNHGEVDAIVSSPPYEQSEAFQDSDFMVKIADEQDERVRAGINKGHPKSAFRTLEYKSGGHASQGHAASEGAEAAYMARMEEGRVTHPDSIGKLRSAPGEIDEILSSIPYENSMSRAGKGGDDGHPEKRVNQHPNAWLPDAKYSDDPKNIGNTQKETYLSAMLRVYSEMMKVLKPGGRAVIVVKPFSRDKKVVDLPWQTWLLLQKVGFEFEDVVKLRLQKLSFWRILQYKKDPSLERIVHEYCLVVRKP